MSLLRIDTQQANEAIDKNMVGYFNSLNKEDYNGMRQYLYPTNNEEYLLDILLKSKAVGVTSVRLQEVYPALVDGNIAIVGFSTSTNATFKGKDVTTRQNDVFFFRKKDGKWYIAKPEDLKDISSQKIADMIDAYQPTMKKHMAGGIQTQQEYNGSAYDKLIKKEVG